MGPPLALGIDTEWHKTYLDTMADKTDMAEDRTDWAEDRTVLANERTFAGWMRTGMAALAIAIGMRAVFGPFEPTWLAKAGATIFLLAAFYIFWSAWRQSCTTLNRLSDHTAKAKPTRDMTLIFAALSLGTLATGVILWAL